MKESEKVAVVTGASSGIGKATAFAFAKMGVKVVLADILSEGENVAAEISKTTGTPALFFRCDVSIGIDVEQMIRHTVDRFGRLDYAFNNAGTEGISATTVDCTEENWQRTIDVNLKGVWLCMKSELQQMQKQGSGAIVNCASIAGIVGFQNIPAYTASKHGVIGLTQTAALEFAKQNIRVNAVCPGVIETPMIDRFSQNRPDKKAALVSGEPMGRIGRPEEIAEAVTWLCSEKASFVTGHSMVIDGGWTAQ